MKLTVYADGATYPKNPGQGGYGAVILDGDVELEVLADRYRWTTNNRMEFWGIIEALEWIGERYERCDVVVYSDSQYVLNAIRTRLRSKVYHIYDNGSTKNVDLINRALAACKGHNVELIWIRGHNGNEWNEFCDGIANNQAMRSGGLPDIVYEQIDLVRFKASIGE